jgi:hypothetical protein
MAAKVAAASWFPARSSSTLLERLRKPTCKASIVAPFFSATVWNTESDSTLTPVVSDRSFIASAASTMPFAKPSNLMAPIAVAIESSRLWSCWNRPNAPSGTSGPPPLIVLWTVESSRSNRIRCSSVRFDCWSAFCSCDSAACSFVSDAARVLADWSP